MLHSAGLSFDAARFRGPSLRVSVVEEVINTVLGLMIKSQALLVLRDTLDKTWHLICCFFDVVLYVYAYRHAKSTHKCMFMHTDLFSLFCFVLVLMSVRVFTAEACKASNTLFPAVRACKSLCSITLPSTVRLCIVIFRVPILCMCEPAWESVFCSRSGSLFKPMRVHYCDPSPSVLVPTLTYCGFYVAIFSFRLPSCICR